MASGGKLYGLDELKRRREAREKAEEAKLLKAKEPNSTANVIVTDRGAFKKGGALAPANDFAKPQIFKLTLQGMGTNEPKILVENKERTWVGELPFSTEWNQLFDGKEVRYVIATGDATGRLILEHIIEPRPAHRF